MDSNGLFVCFRSDWNGSWSTRGCSIWKREKDLTICVCNHLTSFAVLMRPDHFQVLALGDKELAKKMEYFVIEMPVIDAFVALCLALARFYEFFS